MLAVVQRARGGWGFGEGGVGTYEDNCDLGSHFELLV